MARKAGRFNIDTPSSARGSLGRAGRSDIPQAEKQALRRAVRREHGIGTGSRNPGVSRRAGEDHLTREESNRGSEPLPRS